MLTHSVDVNLYDTGRLLPLAVSTWQCLLLHQTNAKWTGLGEGEKERERKREREQGGRGRGGGREGDESGVNLSVLSNNLSVL